MATDFLKQRTNIWFYTTCLAYYVLAMGSGTLHSVIGSANNILRIIISTNFFYTFSLYEQWKFT